MANFFYTFTNPVPRPNMVGFDLVPQTVIIDITAATAACIIQMVADGNTMVDGSQQQVIVQLETGDLQAMMDVIFARAVANGQVQLPGTPGIT